MEEEIVFGSRKKIFIRREFFFTARQIIEKTTYIHMQIKNTAFSHPGLLSHIAVSPLDVCSYARGRFFSRHA